MNKKKIIKIVAEIVLILLMGFILYRLFRDSYKDIGRQLANAKIQILLLLLLLGNLYYVIDSIMYCYLFRKEGYRISFFRCLAIGYMCIFFNVTTFGAGIKPAQVMYLRTKGVDMGKAISITTMPYVFHKTLIVIYAVVLLIINNSFVKNSFPSAIKYIYLGVGLSLVVIVGMILVGASEKFHNLLAKLTDRIFRKEKHRNVNAGIKNLMSNLRESTKDIVKDPKAWIIFSFTNFIKMSCWYVIPVIAIYATGGNPGGVTISQAITTTAIMQLIMGVIPTSGGVGSLEVVYALVFAAVFGKTAAGSSLILYRVVTYYAPFLISILILAPAGRDMRRGGKLDKHQ